MPQLINRSRGSNCSPLPWPAHTLQALLRVENSAAAHTFLPWLKASRSFEAQKKLAESEADRTKLEGLLKDISAPADDEDDDDDDNHVVSLFEQVRELRAIVRGGNDSEALNRVRRDMEERLEFLEVSLREEFQHVVSAVVHVANMDYRPT